MRYKLDITPEVRATLQAIDDEAARQRDPTSYNDVKIIEFVFNLIRMRRGRPVMVAKTSGLAIKQLLSDDFRLTKEDVTEFDEFIASVLIEKLYRSLSDLLFDTFGEGRLINPVKIDFRHTSTRKYYVTAVLDYIAEAANEEDE